MIIFVFRVTDRHVLLFYGHILVTNVLLPLFDTYGLLMVADVILLFSNFSSPWVICLLIRIIYEHLSVTFDLTPSGFNLLIQS